MERTLACIDRFEQQQLAGVSMSLKESPYLAENYWRRVSGQTSIRIFLGKDPPCRPTQYGALRVFGRIIKQPLRRVRLLRPLAYDRT